MIVPDILAFMLLSYKGSTLASQAGSRSSILRRSTTALLTGLKDAGGPIDRFLQTASQNRDRLPVTVNGLEQ